MIFQKREKTKKRKEKRNYVSGYADFLNYYPGLGIFETRKGRFVKTAILPKLNAASEAAYLEVIRGIVLIAGECQICSMNGETYLTVAVESLTIEKAVEPLFEKLESIAAFLRKQNCEALRELTIQEISLLIYQKYLFGDRTLFFRSRKKKERLSERMRPYNVKPSDKSLELSGRKVKVSLIANLPSVVAPSFLSEILSMDEERLFASTYISAIPIRELREKAEEQSTDEKADKERLSVIEKYLRRLSEQGEEYLYEECCLIGMKGETPEELDVLSEKIKRITKEYYLQLNELIGQQAEAYTSLIPLFGNKIQASRTVSADNLPGFYPEAFLTESRFQNGMRYGRDELLNKTLFINRLVFPKLSGFLLGSDEEEKKRFLASEQAYVRANGKKNVIYHFSKCTETDAAKETISLESFGMEEKCMLLQFAVLRVLTIGGLLSEEIREEVEEVMEGMEKSGSMRALSEKFLEGCDKSLHQKISQSGIFSLFEASEMTIKIQTSNETVHVYGASDNSAKAMTELAGAVLSGSYEADSNYVYDLEMIAPFGRDLIRHISERNSLYTFYAANDVPVYEAMEDLIAEAAYINILPLKVHERVRLCNILGELLRKEHIRHLSNGGSLLLSYETERRYERRMDE